MVLGIGRFRLFGLEGEEDVWFANLLDRLAPEHPWPRPHEDMYDAVRWVSFLLLFINQR